MIDRVAVTASTRAKASFARIATSVADDETVGLAANLGMFAGEEAAPSLVQRDPAIVAGFTTVLDGRHADIRAKVRGSGASRAARTAYRSQNTARSCAAGSPTSRRRGSAHSRIRE